MKGQAKPTQAKKKAKTGAFKVTISAEDENSSEGESTVVTHALSAESTLRDQWILDSGATCHMCNQENLFVNLKVIHNPLNVTLGDGHTLQASGRGNVVLRLTLLDGKTKEHTFMMYFMYLS